MSNNIVQAVAGRIFITEGRNQWSEDNAPRAVLDATKTAREYLRGNESGLHANPPAPFNPDYDPTAKDRLIQIVSEFEERGLYDILTKDELALLIQERMNRK